MLETIIVWIGPGVRGLAALAFLFSLIVALTHWAVLNQKISAFGGWARLVRRMSDPMLHPIERRIVRSGGNPQDAAFWFVGVTVIAGLLAIALVDWLLGFVYATIVYAQSGQLLVLIVDIVFKILKAAIWIRVLASWIALPRYSRIMRVVHALTDWIIDPLQRFIPTFGFIDVSPLVALLLLSFVEPTVIRLLS